MTNIENPTESSTTAPFEWASLRLVDSEGRPVPCPSNGPFLLVYWAPWCGDCLEQWSDLHEAAQARNGRAAFVSCFSSATEVQTFLTRHPSTVPAWREPSAKTEEDRTRTFHAFLRELAGDPRRWGVPALRELQIEDGRFTVRWK
jgi:hypothetical protein